MQSPSLNKVNLALEKARTPLMIIGGISAFLFILTYLYSIACFVMVNEFGLNPYDYIPFLWIDDIRQPLMWFVFLPLILNTSAVSKANSRIVAVVCLLLTIILKKILLDGVSIWLWTGLSIAYLLLEIIFLVITFKANKFMSVVMIFSAFLRLANVAFVVLNYFLSLSDDIPFSIYYINVGVGFLYYCFMTLYLFALTTRSKAVKDNIAQWDSEKAESIGTPKPAILSALTPPERAISAVSTVQGEMSPPKVPALQGDETYGIPRAAFWCPNCNQQKKVAINKPNMYSQNMCPQCGTPILAWWDKSPKKKFNRFIAGVGFMAGAMFTIMIETVLNEGYIPVIIIMVLGLTYLVISIALFIPAVKFKVESPPTDATFILPQGIFEGFLPAMLKVVLIALFGGLVLFGVARVIMIVIMAII